MTNPVVDLTTDIIKALVKSSEDPRSVMAGIHNAFVFGKLLEEVGLDWDENETGPQADTLLGQLLEHLSEAGKAIGEMRD